MLIDIAILRKIFPYLNYLAVGLGITKLVVYYKSFGIDIVQYLEFSESLILFFNDLIMFFILMVILVVVAIFGGHKPADKQSEIVERVLSHENGFKRFWEYLKENYFTILLMINFSRFNGYFIIFPFVHYISYEANFVLRKRYGTELDSTYFNVFWYIFVFTLMDYSFMQNEIKAVKANTKYTGTTMQLKGAETVSTTDSTLVFVGKTKNYFYLYDKKKETAVIIPSSEVIKVNLKNNYNWPWQHPR